MTFAEADKLHWEILKFLWTCPNKGKERPYCYIRIGAIQANIIEALRTGQYILFRDDAGAIEHFVCYWKVRSEDIEDVGNGIKPAIRWEGDLIYVCEHGNKGGRKSLTKMIGEIRKIVGKGNKGAFWHSWNRHKFEVHTGQRGK